jgi:hypothetical protein
MALLLGESSNEYRDGGSMALLMALLLVEPANRHHFIQVSNAIKSLEQPN